MRLDTTLALTVSLGDWLLRCALRYTFNNHKKKCPSNDKKNNHKNHIKTIIFYENHAFSLPTDIIT